ncbi:MAG: D-arginine dehydrogenase [Myxococcota bacterium]|jgi:D-arginine dehydrogenase
MSSHQVIIIGAGIAGAATAWSLKQAGVTDILILEQANHPGMHSSSRNAAILRTAIAQPALQLLAQQSADFYRNAPSSFSTQPLIDAVGLYITADKGGLPQQWMPSAVNSCVADIRKHYPDFADRDADVWHFADEGTLDIHSLLQAFLEQQKVRTNCKVDKILFDKDTACGVVCEGETIYAQQVVIANGGWANELRSRTGLNQPFQPYRRHLIVSGALPQVSHHLPVVWNTGANEFYFRPESNGLLMSACDHQLVDPQYGENIDPTIIESVASKVDYWLPGLHDLQPKHLWSGLRTFSADSNFVVGPDPAIGNLFWAAGLAGHGMSTAYAVGQLLSDWMLTGTCAHASAAALLPQRKSLVDLPSLAGIQQGL